jgi:energy-coupling factor transporter transmembrane protein EcfT
MFTSKEMMMMMMMMIIIIIIIIIIMHFRTQLSFCNTDLLNSLSFVLLLFLVISFFWFTYCFLCVCVCVCVCMCVCVYVCMYVCMCVCVYVCMYVYMYVTFGFWIFHVAERKSYCLRNRYNVQQDIMKWTIIKSELRFVCSRISKQMRKS